MPRPGEQGYPSQDTQRVSLAWIAWSRSLDLISNGALRNVPRAGEGGANRSRRSILRRLPPGQGRDSRSAPRPFVVGNPAAIHTIWRQRQHRRPIRAIRSDGAQPKEALRYVVSRLGQDELGSALGSEAWTSLRPTVTTPDSSGVRAPR